VDTRRWEWFGLTYKITVKTTALWQMMEDVMTDSVKIHKLAWPKLSNLTTVQPYLRKIFYGIHHSTTHFHCSENVLCNRTHRVWLCSQHYTACKHPTVCQTSVYQTLRFCLPKSVYCILSWPCLTYVYYGKAPILLDTY